MNTMESAATAYSLPEHITEALSHAAGLASRRLEREAGLRIDREALLAAGIEFAQQQAQESGGRHPAPHHALTFKDIMTDLMIEWHTT